MKLTVFILCSILLFGILLFMGCGSDESVSATKSTELTLPNYFPDAIGSRWVYRAPNGTQWTREVAYEESLHGNIYGVLTYTPPINDATFNLLRISRYRLTQNRVITFVGEEINRYVKAKVPAIQVIGAFEGLEIEVQVSAISERELVFCRIPPTPNVRWDVLNVKVEGNIILQGLALLQLPFEMHLHISGTVIAPEKTIQTPAGTFENTYQLEYRSGHTLSIMDKEETSREIIDTVWLAPHVGIVRFEDERGITELVDYTLP